MFLLAAIAVASTVGAATVATTVPLRIGTIRIERDDIFSTEEIAAAHGLNRLVRRTMNALHVSTRPWVIRKELLFAAGDTLDTARLEETARNLRSLGILAGVTVTPVDTTADGRVTVAVRYRESWTLTSGVSFALASDGSARWRADATEQNFLGQGVALRATVGQDADASYGSLAFRQDRFLKSPFSLELNYDDRSDGYYRWARAMLPFRSDDQAWMALAHGWQDNREVRWYLSHTDHGVAADDEASLYALLPRRYDGFELLGGRHVGPTRRGRVWRIGAGVHVEHLRYDLRHGLFELSDDRVVDLSDLGEAGSPLARVTGTAVWPLVWLQTQGRTWTTAHYVMRYGDQEDLPLDPVLELRVGPQGPAVGSTTPGAASWRVKANADDWSRLGPSFVYVHLETDAVLAERETRHGYGEALVSLFWHHTDGARPPITRVTAEAVRAWNQRGELLPVLGLDRGLRTLALDGMAGDRLVRWNVEHGQPLPLVLLGMFQMGWAAFYDGGVARFGDEPRGVADARQELGVGLRLGATRSGAADVARIDLSWSLDGGGPVITSVARGFF